jgi:hypothetical protein
MTNLEAKVRGMQIPAKNRQSNGLDFWLAGLRRGGSSPVELLELVICVNDRGKAVFDRAEFRTRDREVSLSLVRTGVNTVADAAKACGSTLRVYGLRQHCAGGSPHCCPCAANASRLRGLRQQHQLMRIGPK